MLAAGAKVKEVAWRHAQKTDSDCGSGPNKTLQGARGETVGRHTNDVMLIHGRRKGKIAMNHVGYAATKASLGNACAS